MKYNLILILVILFNFSCAEAIEKKTDKQKSSESQVYFGVWEMYSYKNFAKPNLSDKQLKLWLSLHTNIIIKQDKFVYGGLDLRTPKYKVIKIKENGRLDAYVDKSAGDDRDRTSLFYDIEKNRKYKYVVQVFSNSEMYSEFEVISDDILLTQQGNFYFYIRRKK